MASKVKRKKKKVRRLKGQLNIGVKKDGTLVKMSRHMKINKGAECRHIWNPAFDNPFKWRCQECGLVNIFVKESL